MEDIDPFAADFASGPDRPDSELVVWKDRLSEYPHATVLIWAKQFAPGSDPYTYLAMKAGDGPRGRWYQTGRVSDGWSSTKLAAELTGSGIGQIHIATGWERIK